MTDVADNTLVDGRYRILTRIGSGGMADVYAAQDTHLGREVAIKLLHRRFARDTQFVERFRREASSAAGLQHPNVVNVFDRGEHDGTYYIAMEHLRGRPLKDLVADGPMPQERAIDLGIQMLEAAGFAHRRGVIHRDFKPHNVIVESHDGGDVAKVTDFGIARAGASEMTETGSIMGTAHYLSPEQAQGHAVTPASDLYSIGVVIYEMLTGRVPFAGDSAVAIALKHLSEPPPPPSSLRPDVHPALEAAVMRALEKDPAARYRDAEEFVAALRRAREAIASGETGFDTAVFAPAAAGAVVADEAVPAPPGQAPPEKRRRRVIAALLLVALALLGLGLLALSRGDEVPVPSVVGQDLRPASLALDRAGFDVSVERRPSEAPRDRVLDQDPDGGQKADEGSTVALVVSSGPATRTVPSVARLPEGRAVRKLTRAGFKVETERASSATVGRGRAIRTVPAAGTEVPVGSRLRLVVSAGPRRVAVPDVVGLTQPTAESVLDRRGLAVAVERRAADAPEDQVIAQFPEGGTEVDEGSRVTIVVSQGRPEPRAPSRATVPDVVGMTRAEAARSLRNAGFSVSVQERAVDDPSQDGVVVAQRPSGGARREPGATVLIVVGKSTAEDTDGDGGGGSPRRPAPG